MTKTLELLYLDELIEDKLYMSRYGRFICYWCGSENDNDIMRFEQRKDRAIDELVKGLK
jgi:hypothetical protein